MEMSMTSTSDSKPRAALLGLLSRDRSRATLTESTATSTPASEKILAQDMSEKPGATAVPTTVEAMTRAPNLYHKTKSSLIPAKARAPILKESKIDSSHTTLVEVVSSGPPHAGCPFPHSSFPDACPHSAQGPADAAIDAELVPTSSLSTALHVPMTFNSGPRSPTHLDERNAPMLLNSKDSHQSQDTSNTAGSSPNDELQELSKPPGGHTHCRCLASTSGVTEQSDVERGVPNFERVILRINGLKCGCCDAGISRAIDRISAIRNHQVNIALARVHFDLDISRTSPADVIKRLNAKTGYTFDEQIIPSGQVLEFVVDDCTRIKQVQKPPGVTEVEVSEQSPWRPSRLLCGLTNKDKGKSPAVDILVDGSTDHPASITGSMKPAFQKPEFCLQVVRVHYDANKIGARELKQYYNKYDLDLRLAPLAPHPSLALGAKQSRQALWLFLPTLALTLPVLVLAWAPVDHNKLAYAHVSLVLATAVQTIALKEFAPNAFRSLCHSQTFEMDFLIALSTTTAYIFSVVSYTLQLEGNPLETGSFFETSTLLVTLILLGRVINEFSRFRAAKSVSFRSLQVDEALLVQSRCHSLSNEYKTKKVDARLLQYGDYFQVSPHTKIVTDGVVVYGGSEVDESMITGESIPVAKGVHSPVFAGTNNGSGLLVVKLTKLPHENSVHRIAAMVEDAELTKPKVQALADNIAGWFVPAIAGLGLSVFLIWLFVDKYHFKHSWKNSVTTAIAYAISTLIVSCPCAIGLAVPMVILIAGGVAARFGIIFRDPQKLEIARNVTDVVFDKTGTLTCGFPIVVDNTYKCADPARTKGLILGLLKDINHPVSAGVVRHLEQEMRMHPGEKIKRLRVSNIISIPGAGVKGTCEETNEEILAGNPEWLNIPTEHSSTTLLCVKIGSFHHATFALHDRPRHTAELVISKLQARNIAVHMISGDTDGAVASVAHTLNIPKRHTKARCKPDGKVNYVKDLQQPGKTVMFVGDGTNDSPALKQADVGVHVHTGSDIARHAADVVLMTTRLHDILILLDISAAAYRRIILNFSWSALYNVSAVLLAAGAFSGLGKHVRIEPRWAGLGELVSVLPVVLVAFSMRWRRYGRGYRRMEYDFLRGEGEEEGER